MSRYVGWYLVEIERRLQHEMPLEDLEALKMEVHSHLVESAEEIHEKLPAAPDPYRIAVDRFGPPKWLARRIKLDRAGVPSSWKAAIAVIPLALAGATMPVAALMYKSILPIVFILYGLIALAIFAAFLYARRIMLGTVLATTLLGYVVAVSACSVLMFDGSTVGSGVPMTKAELQERPFSLQEQIELHKMRLADLREKHSILFGSDDVAMKLKTTDGYPLPDPHSRFYIEGMPEINYGNPSGYAPSLKYARLAWKRDYPSQVELLENTISTKQRWMKSVPEAQTKAWWENWLPMAYQLKEIIPVLGFNLLGLNMLGYLSFWGSRRLLRNRARRYA